LRRDSPDAGERLRLRFVRSIAVPVLGDEPLFVALRGPDNIDVIAPARRQGDEVEVEFAGLPRVPWVVFVGRLLTRSGDQYLVLNQPLASYRWDSPGAARVAAAGPPPAR
jgi:hypothetical protein